MFTFPAGFPWPYHCDLFSLATVENCCQSPSGLSNSFHKQSCIYCFRWTVLFCFVRCFFFTLVESGSLLPPFGKCLVKPTLFGYMLTHLPTPVPCSHQVMGTVFQCINRSCPLSFLPPAGVWWYRPRSLCRAWRWTQWAVLAPAVPWPLPAPQTSSLLHRLHPRAWSTLQVIALTYPVSIHPNLTSSIMLLTG